jgi:hypothetical protein
LPLKKQSDFSTVLEAAEHLPLDAQEELVEILHKRTVEQRRTELAAEVRSARADFKKGHCKATSAEAIMADILA